jgi:flagellum-specific peptidoglycan hydrolase FlgJ
MMDPLKKEFIARCSVAARMIAYPFPDMAGCEAALESQKPGVVPFTLSELAANSNNLFGMKAHQHNVYGVVNLPTHEVLSGEWTVVSAAFESYPTLDDCFADRYATLRRLSSIYPHYKAALAASDPYVYITEVSRTWSTDPKRAEKVIAIYNEYLSEKDTILVPAPPPGPTLV